ncbi:hypothetical protein [Caballeronia sordidicola]|uniref:Uncharacterized protein n=1 Tax=Caballeronia sordidicola TaxID=196367 RepID=A0A242N726_CABSO|nr:hypothetical protein [Caballeronia sordidicola]OTP79489.1 hypothetical protein PAMC26577_01080 [Caballeronia sordidicola]
MVEPLGRTGLRLAVLAALRVAPVAPTIQSPGDWSTPPAKLPAILVRPGGEVKDSKGPNGETQFDTTAAIEIRVIVSGATGEAALDAVEALGATVEDVVFKDYSLRRLVQNFRRVDTITEIKADGKVHFGAISMAIHCQFFEAFDPDVTATLQQVTVTADLTNVADPTGTYVDPLFPDAATPAPRTSGPDGRAEGGIDVDLSQ